MTHTTTTPPPARGGDRPCQHCGEPIPVTRSANAVYCSTKCNEQALYQRRVERTARNAQRLAERREAQRIELMSAHKPLVSRRPAPAPRRASTLAETPDVPAVTAARGDFLTGAAAATMQAVSGGRNLSL